MRKYLLLFFSLLFLTGNIFSQDNYFSLGGHLFAGEYPINNPVTTGDTGVVLLYNVRNNSIIPVDTSYFSSLGYFVFLDVPEGEYLLKAGLTNSSTHYDKFFPTYYSNSLRWNVSNSIKITDSDIFEANIRLLPTPVTLYGIASIKGCVVQSSDEDGYRKMQGTEVILLNENLEPLSFFISDHNGNFSFSSLPFGTYHLSVELTGMFSVLKKVILDQDHADFDNLILEVVSHKPANTEDLETQNGIMISNVFPDPANDYIQVIIKSAEPERFDIGIFSLAGIKITSFPYRVMGARLLEIPVGSLPCGTYILMIRSADSHFTKVQKFIKI